MDSHLLMNFLMSDTNTLYHETDQSIQKNEHPLALDESLPSGLNHDTELSQKK